MTRLVGLASIALMAVFAGASDEADDLENWWVCVANAPVLAQSKQVGTMNLGAVFESVEARDGRLQPRRGQGWVNRRHVVSIREGESLFSERLRRNPKDAEALLARGSVRLVIARIRHTAGEDGLSDLAAALRLLPNDGRVLKARGTFLAEIGQDAVPDLNAAIRLDPKDSELFLARAEALSDQCGGCDEALKDATRAIELDGTNADAYYCRASIWGARNNPTEEMQDLSSAITIDPAHSKSLTTRSERLASQGDFEAAVNDLSRIIESTNDQEDVSWALYRRGEFRRLLGQWSGAMSDWSDILRRDPGHFCLLSRSLLLSGCPDPKLRDGKKALADAERATKEGNSNPEVLEAMAAAYAELGDFEKAELTQHEAIDAFTVRTVASDDARVNAQLQRMEARAESYSRRKPFRYAAHKRSN